MAYQRIAVVGEITRDQRVVRRKSRNWGFLMIFAPLEWDLASQQSLRQLVLAAKELLASYQVGIVVVRLR